jgi:hypothetical protein
LLIFPGILWLIFFLMHHISSPISSI